MNNSITTPSTPLISQEGLPLIEYVSQAAVNKTPIPKELVDKALDFARNADFSQIKEKIIPSPSPFYNEIALIAAEKGENFWVYHSFVHLEMHNRWKVIKLDAKSCGAHFARIQNYISMAQPSLQDRTEFLLSSPYKEYKDLEDITYKDFHGQMEECIKIINFIIDCLHPQLKTQLEKLDFSKETDRFAIANLLMAQTHTNQDQTTHKFPALVIAALLDLNEEHLLAVVEYSFWNVKLSKFDPSDYGFTDPGLIEKLWDRAQEIEFAKFTDRFDDQYIKTHNHTSKAKELSKTLLATNALWDFENHPHMLTEAESTKLVEQCIQDGVALNIPKELIIWFFDHLRDVPLQRVQQHKFVRYIITWISFYPHKAILFKDRKLVTALKSLYEGSNFYFQRSVLNVLFRNADLPNLKQNWSTTEISKDHLFVPTLLLTFGGIPATETRGLLTILQAKYYENLTVITQINEFLDLLVKTPKLDMSVKLRLLKIVLTDAERDKQRLVIPAIRDILQLEEYSFLTEVNTIDQITQAHRKFCRKIFKVEGSDTIINNFSSIFGDSGRYPNALLNYAVRLYMLGEYKEPYIETLGLFVSQVLNNKFPSSRYQLSHPHLKQVFGENPEFLEKWKSHVKFNADSVLKGKKLEKEEPYAIFHKMLKQGIGDRDIGSEYEELNNFKGWDDPALLKIEVDKIGTRLKELAMQIAKDKSKKLLDEKRRLTAVKLSFELSLPATSQQQFEQRLQALLSNLEGPYKKFASDISRQITSPATNSDKWVVETTDNWLDLLLLGTEVANSCQSIIGNPKYNKCLLAYIMDGKIKPIVVKDENGKIIARSILRILWDDVAKKPVIYLERLYTKHKDPKFAVLIKAAAHEIATHMNLPIVCKDEEFEGKKPYPNPIMSLGTPAPAEYVDALHDIQEDGKFTIKPSIKKDGAIIGTLVYLD